MTVCKKRAMWAMGLTLGVALMAAGLDMRPAASQNLSRKQALEIYQTKEGFKAFAAARGQAWGMSFGAHSLADARARAVSLCQKNRRASDGKCRIITDDGTYGPIKGFNYNLSSAARIDYEQNYLPLFGGNKAFATSIDGPWAWGTGRSEATASRQALKECNALGENLSPCQIIDVNGYRRQY
jgi:hypothetical protein